MCERQNIIDELDGYGVVCMNAENVPTSCLKRMLDEIKFHNQDKQQVA